MQYCTSSDRARCAVHLIFTLGSHMNVCALLPCSEYRLLYFDLGVSRVHSSSPAGFQVLDFLLRGSPRQKRWFLVWCTQQDPQTVRRSSVIGRNGSLTRTQPSTSLTKAPASQHTLRPASESVPSLLSSHLTRTPHPLNPAPPPPAGPHRQPPPHLHAAHH